MRRRLRSTLFPQPPLDFPRALREWNTYRNRASVYKLQTCGIQSIPLLRGDPDTIGHNNYMPGKSVLHMTMAHAQELVETHGGKGRWHEPNKETVDFHETIGTWVSIDGKERLKTTMGTIHFGKPDAISFVRILRRGKQQ